MPLLLLPFSSLPLIISRLTACLNAYLLPCLLPYLFFCALSAYCPAYSARRPFSTFSFATSFPPNISRPNACLQPAYSLRPAGPRPLRTVCLPFASPLNISQRIACLLPAMRLVYSSAYFSAYSSVYSSAYSSVYSAPRDCPPLADTHFPPRGDGPLGRVGGREGEGPKNSSTSSLPPLLLFYLLFFLLLIILLFFTPISKFSSTSPPPKKSPNSKFSNFQFSNKTHCAQSNFYTNHTHSKTIQGAPAKILSIK